MLPKILISSPRYIYDYYIYCFEYAEHLKMSDFLDCNVSRVENKETIGTI